MTPLSSRSSKHHALFGALMYFAFAGFAAATTGSSGNSLLGTLACQISDQLLNGQVIIGIGTVALAAVAVGHFWGGQMTETMKSIVNGVLVACVALSAGTLISWAAVAAGKSTCSSSSAPTITISQASPAPVI